MVGSHLIGEPVFYDNVNIRSINKNSNSITGVTPVNFDPNLEESNDNEQQYKSKPDYQEEWVL